MADPPPIVITGATGLVGGRLAGSLHAAGYPLRLVTRRSDTRTLATLGDVVRWDGLDLPDDALRAAGAVVHLSGEPIFAGRLTRGRRRIVTTSRVESTRRIAAALADLPEAERPRVLISASAVGVYGSRGDEILDEAAETGTGFLAELCRDWEETALDAKRCGVRVAVLRIGLVLAREGGALPRLLIPFRLGLGGRLGNGQQWMPWIHLDDLVALIRHLLDDASFGGRFNAVAPEPIRNAEFTRSLAATLRRPALLPVPAFAIRAALGELSGELLGSRRCVPRRLREAGFRFAHPTVDTALRAELK